MQTLKKTEWPKFIADQLGIPTVMGSQGPWHSSGDTTDKVWFVRVSEVLGVPYAGERVRSMRALIESLGQTWNPDAMSSAATESAGGGNLKVAAFQSLWAGIVASQSGDNALENRQEVEDLSAAAEGDWLPDRQTVLRQIRRRQGQPAFRAALLDAYDYRCAISNSDIQESLEAAHITAFSLGGPMSVSNGLLLRADVHTLFDLRLIAVDTKTWKVLVNPKLASTESGRVLSVAGIRLPSALDHRPSISRLDSHRHECRL